MLVEEAEGGMVLEEELEIEAQRDSPENNSSTIINCIMLVLYITQVLYLKSRSYRTWIETKTFHQKRPQIRWIATILHLPLGALAF